jgi:hypothetical protein
VVSDLDLPAVVFCLDGRSYVLDAAEPLYVRAERPVQEAA